jgi:hypothetical protein
MSATSFVHSKNVRATITLTTWIVPASALLKNARKTFTSTQSTASADALNHRTTFVPLVLLGALQIATVNAMQLNLRAKMSISTWIRSYANVSVMKFFAKQVKFGTNNNVPVSAVRESALTTSTGTMKTVSASVRP